MIKCNARYQLGFSITNTFSEILNYFTSENTDFIIFANIQSYFPTSNSQIHDICQNQELFYDE